jgi:hypothetical protein
VTEIAHAPCGTRATIPGLPCDEVEGEFGVKLTARSPGGVLGGHFGEVIHRMLDSDLNSHGRLTVYTAH